MYSECSSGAFCEIFVLFLDTNHQRVGKGRTQKVGSLVIQPFANYKNAIHCFDNHSEQSYHRVLCEKRSFKRIVETPGLDIRDQINQKRFSIKHLNHNRLVPIIETILFLGRQELAFRGRRGESGELTIEEPNHNEGEFRAALQLRIEAGDIVLKNNFSSCGANAKYICPMIQNYIMNITGSLISQKIVTEVRNVAYFPF